MDELYEYLSSLMRQRKVKAEEIKQALIDRGLKSSQAALESVIERLSNYFPVYECDQKGFYKILTDEDIEAYRNDLRNNRKHKE